MKKIIDYLFYRYYLISIKNEEFPRFGQHVYWLKLLQCFICLLR